MEQNWKKAAQHLWDTYVPADGQADTVQGELIRAIGKLQYEAQTNGNVNWNNYHKVLANYIKDTLINSKDLSSTEEKELSADIKKLLKYNYPQTEDDIYDRVSQKIVKWYQCNKDPIPFKHDDLHGPIPSGRPADYWLDTQEEAEELIAEGLVGSVAKGLRNYAENSLDSTIKKKLVDAGYEKEVKDNPKVFK